MAPSAGPVRAAGGVVWRTNEDGVAEILLVHRPRYDDWSLPKGKAEPGESDEDTARREVEEETGLRCELGPELATAHYVDHLGRPKTVRFWAMTPSPPARAPTDPPAWTPNDEVDVMVWLPPEDARRRMSYARELPAVDGFEATILGRAPRP